MGAPSEVSRRRKAARANAASDGSNRPQRPDIAAAEEKRRQAEQDRAREEERLRVADEQAKAKAEVTKTALVKRQADAFAAIDTMPTIVTSDLPTASGLGSGKAEAVDLGPLDVAELLDLSFSLAVPKETLGGSLFSAWVDPVEDAKTPTWMIRSAATTSFEAKKKPIDLAALTAEEGRIVLRPASGPGITDSRFKLLRRSVLLIEATDPTKPDEKASVRKAIQLVRPVQQSEVYTVLLITEKQNNDSPTKKRFQLPKGITVAAGANGTAPALPLEGTTIEYEVAFDYQPTGGERNPVVYRRDLGSPSFCELLTCPAAPNIPANPPTMIGVAIDISLPAGEMRITPATNGPGKHVFDLDRIGPLVGQTDKEYEQYKSRMTISLRRRAEPLWKCSVEQFPALADQSTKLTNEYRNEITHFLERTLPDTGEAGQRSSFQRWVSRGDVILRQAQAVPSPGTLAGTQLPGRLLGQVTQQEYDAAMAEPRRLWKAEYSDRLKAWFEDYVARNYAVMDEARSSFGPLRSTVRVVVRRIATAAFDSDGAIYSVVLIAADAASDSPEEQSGGGDPAAARRTNHDID